MKNRSNKPLKNVSLGEDLIFIWRYKGDILQKDSFILLYECVIMWVIKAL